jgi:hypothetical protein
MANRNRLPPIHPGEILREEFPVPPGMSSHEAEAKSPGRRRSMTAAGEIAVEGDEPEPGAGWKSGVPRRFS